MHASAEASDRSPERPVRLLLAAAAADSAQVHAPMQSTRFELNYHVARPFRKVVSRKSGAAGADDKQIFAAPMLSQGGRGGVASHACGSEVIFRLVLAWYAWPVIIAGI
ncbi:hypothetical protein MTO96_038132 [Rhipicephalus appendiculatus]